MPRSIAWRFIPAAAVFAYLATLVANTVRISTALRLQQVPLEISWLSPNQLHRFEGIFIYFGFLLLLFMVSEKMSKRDGLGKEFLATSSGDAPSLVNRAGIVKQSLFPLLVYYATALGIPLINGAYRQGSFWEHSLFVLLTPLLLMLPILAFQFFKDRSAAVCARDMLPFNKPAKQVKA